MRLLKLAIPIAALVAAMFILYTKVFSVSDNTLETDSSTPAIVDAEVPEPGQEKQADIQPEQDNSPAYKAEQLEPVKASELNSTSRQSSPSDFPQLLGYEVGTEDISEEDYLELVDRLRKDPALLADVLNELRAETDPDRIKRLTIMLGATGSADVLPVAEELVYSSNSLSRETGLDLLSRVAPQNPEAYDIANSILGSEADADILVSTMNVLARPKNAAPETKATAISQIMPLANHESAAVRRQSVSLLVRLTNDETLSPVLQSALSDPDASVRKAAAYAYASYPYQTAEAVQRLMDIVEDSSEESGVRKGAILAVSKMSPDAQTTERIEAAKKQMRKSR